MCVSALWGAVHCHWYWKWITDSHLNRRDEFHKQEGGKAKSRRREEEERLTRLVYHPESRSWFGECIGSFSGTRAVGALPKSCYLYMKGFCVFSPSFSVPSLSLSPPSLCEYLLLKLSRLQIHSEAYGKSGGGEGVVRRVKITASFFPFPPSSWAEWKAPQ